MQQGMVQASHLICFLNPCEVGGGGEMTVSESNRRTCMTGTSVENASLLVYKKLLVWLYLISN